MKRLVQALRDAVTRLTRENPARMSDEARIPDAAQRMFAKIGRRQTMWYTLVLAIVLLLAGVLLYGGMQAAVYKSTNDLLTLEAAQHAALLAQTNGGATACQLVVAHERPPFFMACYDASGTWLAANSLVQEDAPKFIRTDLAQAALNSSSGMASAIIDGGDNGNG
ncbi:MAG TPA: hypothetical protein VF807_03140, partial [Ktedonobacterales bacterium]